MPVQIYNPSQFGLFQRDMEKIDPNYLYPILDKDCKYDFSKRQYWLAMTGFKADVEKAYNDFIKVEVSAIEPTISNNT